MGASESLGTFVSLIRGTTYKGVLVGAPGPALLGLGAITPGGGFREGDFKTYGGDCPEKLLLGPGDLFVSLKGATKDGEMIGSVARVPASVPSGRLTQDTVKLDFKSGSTAFRSYIYWLLRTPHYRQYCAARATGSAVVALSREDFLAYEVPPLDTARGALVTLFDAVEEKIRLNRRMCQTLEEMARALFKSWFVDFDPVRAKMEGRDPGLPKEIADLFPSRLVASELGPIPEGWVVQPLAEGFAITMGQSPPGSSYNEIGNGLAFFQGRADFGFRFPRYRVYTIEPTRFAEAGDTLVSVRAPVGDVNMAPSRCCVGRGVAAVRHQSGACSYTYYAMKFLEPEFEKFESEGTVFGSISKRDFHGLRLPAPASVVLRAFEEKCGALDARIEIAEREQATLAALRDTLLPKLISGEVRVPASLGSMQEVAS